MATYGPATYGDRIAEMYDAFLPPAVEANTQAAVAFLRDLAAGGPALELGIRGLPVRQGSGHGNRRLRRVVTLLL